MALLRGHRFPVEFDEAFPQGLVLMGEIEPDHEYQSQEDRARGKEQRQRVDEVTGLRRWKATVTDPHEVKAKRASFEVIFLAEVQPAPLPAEVLPGMRPVELVDVQVAPKVAGQGEFKYQSYDVYASGVRAPGSGTGSSDAGQAGRSEAKAGGQKPGEAKTDTKAA